MAGLVLWSQICYALDNFLPLHFRNLTPSPVWCLVWQVHISDVPLATMQLLLRLIYAAPGPLPVPGQQPPVSIPQEQALPLFIASDKYAVQVTAPYFIHP